MLRTVLVFGGSGMLGSFLIPYLESIGHKVICVGRKLNKTNGPNKIIIDDYNDGTLSNILDEYNPRFVIILIVRNIFFLTLFFSFAIIFAIKKSTVVLKKIKIKNFQLHHP